MATKSLCFSEVYETRHRRERSWFTSRILLILYLYLHSPWSNLAGAGRVVALSRSPGAKKQMEENLKADWAKFSTLS